MSLKEYTLVVVLALLLSSPVRGGSIVHQELATLKEVDVWVVAGALSFDPSASIHRSALVDDLKRNSAATLAENGVRVREAAPARLIIEVSHCLAPKAKGWVALEILVRLDEPAHLSARQAGELRAGTWVDSQVILVEGSEADEKLREVVSALVASFASAVKQARD